MFSVKIKFQWFTDVDNTPILSYYETSPFYHQTQFTIHSDL